MWLRRSSTLRPRALHEHSILRHLPHTLHTAIVQLHTRMVNLREEGASERGGGGARTSLYSATRPLSHSYLDPSASRKRTVLSPKHSVFSAITVENCGVSLSNAAWPKPKYTHIARATLMGAGRHTRDQVRRFPTTDVAHHILPRNRVSTLAELGKKYKRVLQYSAFSTNTL